MKTDSFVTRHIGPQEDDLNTMFKTVGVKNMDELLYETFPDGIRLKSDLNLPEAMTEYEYLAHLKQLATKNKVFKTD